MSTRQDALEERISSIEDKIQTLQVSDTIISCRVFGVFIPFSSIFYGNFLTF